MNQNPAADAVIDDFLERHRRLARGDAVFEQLREGSNYFSLERRGASADEGASYALLRSPPSQGVDRIIVGADALAQSLRGSIPFIPTLLSISGRSDWAAEARALNDPRQKEKSYLFDALRLPGVQLTLQFDWRDAKVPDGFKLGAMFSGEDVPAYYLLHNDMIASAVETKQSILGQVMRISPKVFERAVVHDPDLLARWERASLGAATPPGPPPVQGRRGWI